MSAAAAERKITAELATKLGASGFRKKHPDMIVRNWGDGIAQVILRVWKDRFSGPPMLEMWFAMRFDEVHALVGEPEEDADSPTISVPSHILREDQHYA